MIGIFYDKNHFLQTTFTNHQPKKLIMKKVIFSLSLLVVSLFSFAQQKGNDNKTPEQRAQHKTQKLTSQLSLTTDQSSQVQNVFLQQEQQMAAVKSKYANAQDKSGMRAEMKPIRENTDKSLQSILTPDQYTKYQTMKEEHKGEHGGHGH